jgi:hypothetical protein
MLEGFQGEADKQECPVGLPEKQSDAKDTAGYLEHS